MSGKVNTLWVPEKPSVARAVVESLVRVYGLKIVNTKTAGRDGYTKLSNGDVVCSVIGHMLVMLPPSRYLTREQNNDLMSVLPLLPDEFKLEPKPEIRNGKVQMRKGEPVTSVRYLLLERLFKQAKSVVNACDIDREGQLIFDSLARFVGVDPAGSNIKRILINDMAPSALDKAVSNLEQNGDSKWQQRGAAALARQRMDWLLGMNASMAYQVVTGIRTMSVGRVQTPLLAMVVKRDIEIENFKPQDYYVPVVIMSDGTRLRWEKREGSEGEPGFDANGRIIDISLAQGIVDKIRAGLAGTVKLAKVDERSEAPPMPFSMSSLQIQASREHGLSVKQVTKAAQSLYEKHKAITYVGTDCEFLPETMHSQAYEVLQSLSRHFKQQAAGANPKLKSRAFNDKKIDEHFAIVPTGNMPNLGADESDERKVFQTISNRYMAQFYPNYRYAQASVAVSFDKDEFRASSRKDLEMGWKNIEAMSKKGEVVDGGEKEVMRHKEREEQKS